MLVNSIISETKSYLIASGIGRSMFFRLCLALVLMAGVPAYSQIFSFGVRAGVPFNGPYSANGVVAAVNSAYQNHYIIGPTAELHLVLHLSLEVDALYRRNGLAAQEGTALNVRAAVNDWQVPVLVKYETRFGPVRPFVGTGVVYRHVGAFAENQIAAPQLCAVGTSCVVPIAQNNANTVGYAVGGGVTFKIAQVRISPEIRFTQWGKSAFTVPLISTTNSQADLLVGLTF